jgi:hypothetical protein
MKNSRLLPILALLIATGLIAAVVSLGVRKLDQAPDLSETHDFDHWLHKQLDIKGKQHDAMAAGETAYHHQQRQLIAEIKQLNADLSVAMVEERKASPRIISVIEKIHAKQGELQNASIMHIFELEKDLTPEQYNKLLKIAAETLKSGASQ